MKGFTKSWKIVILHYFLMKTGIPNDGNADKIQANNSIKSNQNEIEDE